MTAHTVRARRGVAAWRCAILLAGAAAASGRFGLRLADASNGIASGSTSESSTRGRPPPTRSQPAVAKRAFSEPLDIVRDPFHSRVLDDAPVVPAVVGDKQSARERIQSEAIRLLALRAVMVGSVRVAMINGRPYHEGDRVAGFQLRRIGSDNVVVEQDGIEVTLCIR